jgi:hypothetical protein
MTRWLKPDLALASVHELTPELLGEHGRRAVVLDADNTLVPRNRYHLSECTAGWITALQAAGVSLCILSNTAHVVKVARMVEAYGMAAIPFARKPFRGGFTRALKALGTTAEETCMVGDQLFTDILGGNLAGLLTVYVPPVSRHDFAPYKLARVIERRLLRRWALLPGTAVAEEQG